MQRRVVWFSCGAPSAVASKLAVKQYDDVEVVYCETGGEHESNKKFLKDIEKWIEHSIVILKNEKYKDHFDCIEKNRYIGGIGVAPCTLRLKKQLRQKHYNNPDDIHIMGYTLEEKNRALKFQSYNPELEVEWILIDREVTKENCLGIIWKAGIELPEMYKLGYNHNNCIGCVKGKMGYWNKIRVDFPKNFERMAKIERKIEYSIHRNKDGNPLYLDELDPKAGNFKKEPPISCDLFCGMIWNDIR